MDFKIFPLQKLISAQFAKWFWDASFNADELPLSEIKFDSERIWEIKLTNFREKAISNLNAFAEKVKLPALIKTILTESIFLLHQAYHELLLWKIAYDPDNKTELLQEGELYAPNYFTVEGEFNEIVWIKRFVVDSKYDIRDRFILASLHWLEDESNALWIEITNSIHVLFGVSFSFEYFGEISGFMSLKLLLHLQMTNPEQGWWPNISFKQMAFHLAVRNGYEHPVYYFWQKLSESEKIGIRYCVFDLMDRSIDYPKSKVCYFLYSQLTNEEKESLLHWSIEHDRSDIWITLLLTPYAKAVRLEILRFVYQLPFEMISNILQVLAHRISQLKLPYDNEIFQILWSKLSPNERHVTLKKSIFIFEYLVIAKSFYNLEYIIKCLSLEEKERCLLNGCYGAGTYCLNILCKEGEFDFLQKYLSFFLMELDSSSQIQILRKDASIFLRTFIESREYISWIRSLSKAQKKEVETILHTLEISLTILDKICEKVCKEVNISSSQFVIPVHKSSTSKNKEIITQMETMSKRKFKE